MGHHGLKIRASLRIPASAHVEFLQKRVLIPNLIIMNQPTPPLAEDEMLQGGRGEEIIFGVDLTV
jgi:hypothetical protein